MNTCSTATAASISTHSTPARPQILNPEPHPWNWLKMQLRNCQKRLNPETELRFIRGLRGPKQLTTGAGATGTMGCIGAALPAIIASVEQAI